MIKSYLINLEQDSERLAFFESNFNRLGIGFERISAVDGRKFPEQQYQDFMKDRPRDHKKTWLRGQMGCFLSHYTAWQKIAEGEDRFCAVFEDDIHISDDLKQILNDDSWIPDEVDLIRLDTSTNRVRLTPQPYLTHANRQIFGVKSTSWCAGGYILNRRTAQQLVNLPVKYHEPSDVILYNFSDSIIARELKIFQFHPALCTQDKHLATGSVGFSSNIEAPVKKQSELKAKLEKATPVDVVRAAYRSLTGYKRIGFQ